MTTATRTDEPTGRPRRSGFRPRLVVIAPAALSVVRHAGGWLFDQSMAGWTVQVVLADPAGDRSLRILGSQTMELRTALIAPLATAGLRCLAIDGDLYRRNPGVRDCVRRALAADAMELRVWSDDRIAGETGGLVRHQLSSAAMAFKVQALAALGLAAEPAVGAEQFHSHVPSGTGKALS